MAKYAPIDFGRLNDALLQQVEGLLSRWLPNGVERNGRWYVGDFDGSAGESANVNMQTGQWIDNAAPDEEKGGDLISLYARVHNVSNIEAARALMEDLGWVREEVRTSAPARSAGSPAPAQADVPDDGGPATATATGTTDAKPKREARWRPIVPVPKHAPQPVFKFGFKDKTQGGKWVELDAVKTWAYEFEGELLGHVARFERWNSKGELVKDTIPLTWCEDRFDDRGCQRWHWKTWDAPRPLYVPATLLSGDLSLPVVIVEGEKCAVAGHQLLGHEFDFVSWPGGCKAWQLAAWGWLMGRTVYLWPDVDMARQRLTKAEREAAIDPATKPLLPAERQPGMLAMVGIGTILLAEMGCNVSMCQVPAPGAVSEGWDIADAIESGWDAARVRDFIRAAVPFVPANDSARATAGMASAGQSTASNAPAGDGEADDVSRAWRKHLLETEKGAIKAVRENAVMALDGWPDKGVPGVPECKGLIAFNQFTNNVVKTRDTPWGTQAGVWGEADELLMGEYLVREHYLPSMPRGTLEEAVLMVAQRHAIHPARERIERLRGTWDGEKRLATWLERCVFAPGCPSLEEPGLRPYLARVGTWFLMAMCARVMTTVMRGNEVYRGPGVKFDNMLILEGPQGWGKSTVAATLGGEYFADTGLNIGEKDSYQNIQGIGVYEWGELENLTKQEVGKIKLFIASPKDRFRATFDRRPRDYPRQVVFVGTTNEANYLTDVTGNRRFWPVRISQPPDNKWLRENLDQLLAEAVTYLDADERFWPTREEQKKLFDPQQRARTVESGIESAIRRYLFDEEQKVPHGGLNGTLVNKISLSDLLDRIGFTIDKQTDVVIKRAGSVMHALGWTVQRTSNPGRPRVYLRPTDAPPAPAGGSDGSTGRTPAIKPENDDDCPF